MATYDVLKVRKHRAEHTGGSHEHIIGVVTSGGTYYTNQEVANSINAGHEWLTLVQGAPKASIRVLSYCPNSSCYHKPYLSTVGDQSAKNNLENLPRG